MPSSKPALDLDDEELKLRLKISLGRGNRRAHLDEDQVDLDLRPLLVEDSSVVDEYERRQAQHGQYEAPLPWANGAKYWVIRRHRADIDGRLLPPHPSQGEPLLACRLVRAPMSVMPDSPGAFAPFSTAIVTRTLSTFASGATMSPRGSINSSTTARHARSPV